MSEINCNACSELKENAPNFVQNGVTSTECSSLANDTGLNPNLSPKHNDVEDLHDVNDCLVGRMENDLEKYNACDWQKFMQMFIPNIYETIKAIICTIGGIWVYIHNLLNRVANLETRMTNLEGRVDALEAWKTTIDAWKTTINNWKTSIDNWKSGIDTWKTSISNTVSGLETRVTNVENTVGGFDSRINALENNYTTLSSTVSGHTTTLNNLSNTVSGHTTSINNLSNTVSGHTTTLNNLSSTVGGHTTQINDLSNTVSGYSSSISQNTSDISALTTKLNNLIAALGGSSTTVPVMRRYRFTVPAEAFGAVWKADHGSVTPDGTINTWYSNNPNGIVEWFSGAGNNQDVGENWIRVPMTDMETVTGVWTQSWVVPSGNSYDGKGKGFMQTVNVQEWYQDGNEIVINFDTFILAPIETQSGGTVTQNGGPYPVTVDFLVVGTKTFSPI